MKAVVRVGKWRPWLGVCCMGVALVGLAMRLEGALPKNIKASRTQVATGGARVSNEAMWAKAAKAPSGGLPIFEPQYVDPYDDEPSRLRRAGLLKGALPLPDQNRMAAGGCTFDIECEDGLKCTDDVCDFDVSTNMGVCTNALTAAGLPGDCDDGVFCNGIEYCDGVNGSTCVNGPDATCCSDPDSEEGEKYCSETVARCDEDSLIPGSRCTADEDCGGGSCDHCIPVCTSNADCLDAFRCNGDETCNIGTGQCQPGPAPCGDGAVCSEKRCRNAGNTANQLPLTACTTDDDCTGANICLGGPADLHVCFLGRCCSNAVDPVCSSNFMRDIPSTAPATTCLEIGGSKFFPGDFGRETGEANTCGGVNPTFPGVQLDCPKYSSGIEQTSATAAPAHPIAAGPMSQSMIAVPMPNGPGTAFNRIGDDYSLSNGSNIELRAIRLVGFMAVPDAIFIEFWSSDGVFIEDLLFRPSTDPGVNVLFLNQPITIPGQGRISAVNKREFGMNSKFVWLSSSGPSTGTNNANVLFVNNDHNASNYMSPQPGVLSFELLGLKVNPPLGGCCKDDGTCSNELEWDCDQLGGTFQGAGILCNVCAHASNAGANCGRCATGGATCSSNAECGANGPCQATDSVCLGARCSNDDNANCTVPSACPSRPGVCSNDDKECAIDGDCPGGTCGGAGICLAADCAALDACGVGACCTAGVCTIDTAGDCAGDFQGLGSDCDPNCCEQPTVTGADDCADAFVHVIPDLDPEDPPYIVTISGDRTTASSTEANPDSCWGAATDVGSDLGWWEAFSLTGNCTRLRFDYCCTTPTQFGDWAFLAKDCACNDTLSPRQDPNLTIQSTADRGPPFCDEDNLWTIMGLMRPGTYYIPINSTFEDVLGPYQLHIVAEACPDAACCIPAGTPVHCPGPTSCCVPEVNQFECDDMLGTFLAPPNRFPGVAACTGTPGVDGTCDTGSCCLGPGICQDEISGTAITDGTCSGSYIGGLKCEGGTCADGPAFSCNDTADCASPGPGGLCNPGPGGDRAIAQPNPCPICEFEAASNCNLWDDPSGFSSAISELGLGSGLIAADDFIPATGATQITDVCAYGSYFFTDPDAPGLDCRENVTADHFRVRIMKSTPDGLPDSTPLGIVGTSTTTITGKAILAGAASLQVGDGYETFGYQLQLDTPIGPLTDDGNTTYWVEIANNLDAGDGCFWLWHQISDESPQGNDFSAGGSGGTGYVIGSQRPTDQAFCLSRGSGNAADFTTPASPIHPCCTCGGVCLTDTLATCTDSLAEYHVDQNSCTGLCPAQGQPARDECAAMEDIYVGITPMSAICTTTDGINPVEGEGGDFSIVNDEWFQFIAPQNCNLRVDMCATGDAFDSAVALYSNGTTNCVCPTTQAIADSTFVIAGDETCAAGAAVGGAAFVEAPAIAGQCFVVRVGQFCCPEAALKSTGLIDISCGPPMCGNNSTEASNGEECDGADDDACDTPGSCNPPGHAQECQCGTPVCGDGVVSGNEECDPGPPLSDAACPGLCQGDCTCNSVCGDGEKQGDEECDGGDDTSCGGVAGRCCTGPNAPIQGCAANCTCPPVTCGNNFKDPNEDCDGTDDANCPGACRVPNDPAGECTCECELTVAVEPLLADPNPINKNRFVGAVVPPPAANRGPGTLSAIRVTLTTLNHPRFCCTNASGTSCSGTTCNVDAHCTTAPNTVCAHQAAPGTPNFSAMEGNIRYVNSFPGLATPHLCPGKGAPFNHTFRCATLGCEPEYRDWATELTVATNPVSAAGLFFLTGDAMVPSSTVHLTHIAASCGAAATANTCTDAALPPLAVGTAKWADISGPGLGPPDGKSDVLDIPPVTNFLKDVSPFFGEERTWLKQRDPAPNIDAITVIELSDAVDGGPQNKPYPASRTIDACDHD